MRSIELLLGLKFHIYIVFSVLVFISPVDIIVPTSVVFWGVLTFRQSSGYKYYLPGKF